jgi:MinD superfamily P-loop ATPase
MLLSEALRKWKSNITTHMAVEYVLTLRADVNAFSDAAYALENENAKLRELVETLLSCPTHEDDCEACKKLNGTCEVEAMMRELEIEVAP